MPKAVTVVAEVAVVVANIVGESAVDGLLIITFKPDTYYIHPIQKPIIIHRFHGFDEL